MMRSNDSTNQISGNANPRPQPASAERPMDAGREDSGSASPAFPLFSRDPYHAAFTEHGSGSGSPGHKVFSREPSCPPCGDSGSGSGSPGFPVFSIGPATLAQTAPLPADGRYRLANEALEMELRVDVGGSHIVSGDVFVDHGQGRDYAASFRSRPGLNLAAGTNPLPVLIEGKGQSQASGYLRLVGQTGVSLLLELMCEQPLRPLPAMQPVAFCGRYEGRAMRVLGVEMEVQEGVDASPVWEQGGRRITVESCLEDAGFEIYNSGSRSNIPNIPQHQGWDDAQLHGLMTQLAQARLDRPAWQLQALMLQKPKMAGLNGVMFDAGSYDWNELPRQGFAVFQHEIRNPIVNRAGDRVQRTDWPRKMIQTVVHELGHALNLAHRFERGVGRADSRSFMNYDWKYLGGGNAARYWRDFQFSFDADELAFLRHGAHPDVIPGGAGFRTVPYWENTDGGYVPYRRQVHTDALSLQLLPPPDGGLFAFAQPVFLGVKLTNHSDTAMDLPERLLDPKAGFLEIVVKRLGSGGAANTSHFRPMVHRCLDLADRGEELVGKDEFISNNLNLTYGSAGFTFMEPGNYEVTAVFSVPLKRQDADLTVASQPLRIRVAQPKNDLQEWVGMEVFRDDIGCYLAFGGSDALSGAEDKLNEILARLMGKRKTVSDPLAVHILRCQALNKTRQFLRYDQSGYWLREPQPDQAAATFKRVESAGTRILDPISAEDMSRLMSNLKSEVKD